MKRSRFFRHLFSLFVCAALFAQPTPTPSSVSVTANKTTGALTGPVSAATFRTVNNIAAGDAATTSAAGIVELATSAEAIAGTDTTRAVPSDALKATLLARTGPIDVRHFGAVCDGVTDDRAAIQAALDSAYPWIIQASGTSLISSVNPDQSGTGLRIPSYKRFTVNGTLKRGTNSITGFIINKSAGVTGGYTANTNIILDGSGTIDGNSGSFSTNCTLVAFGHATDVTIRGVKIVNVPTWHAIELNGTKSATVEGVTIDGVTSGTEAIQLDTMKSALVWPWFGPFDGTKTVDTRILSTRIRNVQDAIGSHSDPAADGVLIDGCTIENITGVGVIPNGWLNLKVANSTFETVTSAFSATSANDPLPPYAPVSNSGLQFVNNRVTSASSVAVNLNFCTAGIVSNNVIRSALSGITNRDASVITRSNTFNDRPIPDSMVDSVLARVALYCNGLSGRAAMATAVAFGAQDFYFWIWYKPVSIRANTFIVEASAAGFGLRGNLDGSLTVRQAGIADILSTPAGALVANEWHFIEVWRVNGQLNIGVWGGSPRAFATDSTDFYGTSPALSSTSAVATVGWLARGTLVNFGPTSAERMQIHDGLGLLPATWAANPGSMTPVTAGSFVTGRKYRIVSAGNTTWTAIGSANNSVNTVFTATGAGSGTGTAVPAGAIWSLGDADRTTGSIVPDFSGNANDFTLSNANIAPALPQQKRVYTVATLPAAASMIGFVLQVTDSNSTTRLDNVAGGGSNIVQVFSNGTNWKIQ